jgi:hypothetical protein
MSWITLKMLAAIGVVRDLKVAKIKDDQLAAAA